MSSNNVTIKVEDLGKCYHIYNQPQDRLKQSIIPRLQALSGRPPKSYFREFWALQNVSFEVRKGETVGIIGRNGSGKSTLLQLICGTLSPTTGRVETRGRIAALLELGSGFNPEFTGRENVYLNGTILGLSKEEIEHMKKEAESFAEQDNKRKELIEVRNIADNTIYTTEKTLRDGGDKIAADAKKEAEEAINKLRKTMETENVEDIRKETEALGQILQKIGASMYQQPGSQPGDAGTAEAGPSSDNGQNPNKPDDGEDVVDGEFKNI